MAERITGLQPLLCNAPRILILGSLPGGESLTHRQYYYSNSNRIWKVLCKITGEEHPESYPLKKELLAKYNIALWDYYQSAVREGSDDKNIRKAIPNDIIAFLKENPTIRIIAINGFGKYDDFGKRIIDDINIKGIQGIKVLKLPETSGSNKNYGWGNLDNLAKEWSKIFDIDLPDAPNMTKARNTEVPKPPELPSKMDNFAYPMKALEVCVTCVEESYAEEQAERIKRRIADALDIAIEKGWDHSNSQYQNLRVNGKTLTFDFYMSFTQFIHIAGVPCYEPLAEYNQYEKPKIESVTFRYVLEDDKADSISHFEDIFCTSLQNGNIDRYEIEGTTITATSDGPNPFGKLINAYIAAEQKIENIDKLHKDINESKQIMKISASGIVTTIAIVILIVILFLAII